MDEVKVFNGKIIISAKLVIVTGLHIGGSSDFAPIGAVDKPFVRDPLTKRPMIPGSSLKGKMRTLLVKATSPSYILPSASEDKPVIKRLFGSSDRNGAMPARLQFVDCFVNEDSAKRFASFDTDTYLGEIKFENSINRATGIANPRQIERVPAGLTFDFNLVYNVEKMDELEDDLDCLREAFKLLQYDYLGGHGSRGYGRVRFEDFKFETLGNVELNTAAYKEAFEGCGHL